MPETESRLRILWVTPEFLVEMCKPGSARFTEATENHLPADARYVRAFYIGDGMRAVGMVIQSAEFEPVPEASQIPDHPAVSFRVVERG